MIKKKVTDHEKKFREELEAIKRASRERQMQTAEDVARQAAEKAIKEAAQKQNDRASSVEFAELSRKVGFIESQVSEVEKKVLLMEAKTPTKYEVSIPSFGRVVVERTSTVERYQKMVDDILVGNNIFLVGEAGTGKTFTAEALCRIIYGEPQDFMMTINCSQWTAPRDIIGGDTIDGYKEGRLIQAWEKGYLLVLDELPKLDPNTAGLLNDALAMTAKKGAVIRSGDGRAVVKHDKFGVVATGNITGKETNAKYGGNNKQDASLIDRFNGSYYHIDFDEALEASLVAPIVFAVYSSMRKILLADGMENDITLRTMLNANRIYELEMFRLEKGEKIANGKTFKDNVESYLFLHTQETAKKIKRDSFASKALTGAYLNSDILDDYKKWRKK